MKLHQTHMIGNPNAAPTYCCPRCGKRQGESDNLCFDCWETLEILRDDRTVPAWVADEEQVRPGEFR